MADIVIIKDESVSTILTVGVQGPQGPAGDQVALSYPAANNLSGHRIVKLVQGSVDYASSANLADANFILGMTTGAASQGSQINILKDGEVTEPSWNWNINLPIYLGLDGLMTQIPPALPASVFSMIVGFPITTTKVFISLREPIILN